MRALKISLYSAVGGALLFGGVSLIFHFGDWPRLIAVTALGAIVGAIGAPELFPDVFESPWRYQLILGIGAGLLIAFAMDLTLIEALLAGIAGGALGGSARWWIRHVSPP